MPTLVRILIDGKPHDLDQGSYKVEDLKKLAGIPNANELAQDVNGVVTTLDPDASVSIDGGEVFVSSPAKVEITINGKVHKARRGTEAVSVLKKLAGVPDADQLEQELNGVLTPLDANDSVKIAGGEVFLSFPAEVTITVDGKPVHIGRGKEPVSVIKKLGGVPAANQLDQDVNGVLTPIDQNGSVDIRGGEVFVSYPATGSSS